MKKVKVSKKGVRKIVAAVAALHDTFLLRIRNDFGIAGAKVENDLQGTAQKKHHRIALFKLLPTTRLYLCVFAEKFPAVHPVKAFRQVGAIQRDVKGIDFAFLPGKDEAHKLLPGLSVPADIEEKAMDTGKVSVKPGGLYIKAGVRQIVYRCCRDGSIVLLVKNLCKVWVKNKNLFVFTPLRKSKNQRGIGNIHPATLCLARLTGDARRCGGFHRREDAAGALCILQTKGPCKVDHLPDLRNFA